MHEGFIHYIWQFQYFDKRELRTTDDEGVEVFKPGISNTHSGPDFSNAKIKIDGMEWAGSVEIHVRSSGWMEHRHDRDPAYENVILHVVWQDDKPVCRSDGTLLPTLELAQRVDPSLIQLYQKLINTSFAIPCRKSFGRVEEVVKRSMADRALAERLEAKAGLAIKLLSQHGGDWRQTTFVLLAGSFGFKINSDPFFQLAQSMSYKILLKHADQRIQLEALLFGQAGFLEIEPGDEYYQLLRREYHLLGRKYNLLPRKLMRAQWRFLRLRPANFPTVRIAQFAALLAKEKNIGSAIFEIETTREWHDLFQITASEYWQSHYQFNKKAPQRIAELGPASVHNILINTVAPLLVAYGKYHDQQRFVDRAVDLLNSLPGEANTIIRSWESIGYVATNAFDSQALIQLYNHYCQKRNCLNCAVGASLLKPTSLK